MVYYSNNNLKLYLGDSKKLINNIFNYDLIFTGPPYGINLNYGIGDDTWVPDKNFWQILFNNSSKNCILAIQVSVKRIEWWLNEPVNAGWVYNHMFCNVIKHRELKFYPNFPHCWEPIIIFSKGPEINLNKLPNTTYTDVFVQHKKLESYHPCPADYDTWYGIMNLLTFDTVLDPFCGTGTSLFCAIKLGKNAIGIDRNEEYLKMFINKL